WPAGAVARHSAGWPDGAVRGRRPSIAAVLSHRMNQSFAVWLLIILSLVTANLPFVVERPFLALPWKQKGEAERPAWMTWLTSFGFFAVLVGLGLAAMTLIGQGVFTATDAASVARFLAVLLALAAVVAVVLAYPGWRNRGRRVHKSFFDRLLELLVFYRSEERRVGEEW